MNHYFELSFRNDPLSGRLSTDIKQKGSLPTDSRPIVILIHGFNNNFAEAQKSFDRFVANLDRSAATNSLPKSICRFYWPGNLTNVIASKASYPQQIPKAKKCAAMLSEYLIDLATLKPYTKFIVVAHSLGSRLILEAILHAESRFPEMADRFTLTVLMAAAVPEYMVNDRYGRLYPVRLSGKKFLGLHSTADGVLTLAFPIGQTLAREGFFPPALGLKGRPESFWTAGGENTHLGHGEYWQSARNSSMISIQLGQSAKRHLPKRALIARKQTYYRLNELSEK